MSAKEQRQDYTRSEAIKRERLIGVVTGMLRTEFPEFISDPRNTRLLATLMAKAELLLDAADTHLSRQIHAYQLFSPNSDMKSAREIAERFKEAGWRKGFGQVRIREIIKKLLKLAESEVRNYNEIAAGILWENTSCQSVSDFLERLEAEVADMIERASIADIVSETKALRTAICASIEQLIDRQLRDISAESQSGEASASFSVGRFMEYVCGYRTLEEYLASGTHPIRPYELFLFASQQGLMTDKLVVSLAGLNEGLALSPAVTSSLSILETHGDADWKAATWAAGNGNFSPVEWK